MNKFSSLVSMYTSTIFHPLNTLHVSSEFMCNILNYQQGGSISEIFKNIETTHR